MPFEIIFHWNIQWEKIFDPLLILYVYRQTKNLSVYNFNGSERQNNNNTIQKNAFHKSDLFHLIFTLYFSGFLMSKNQKNSIYLIFCNIMSLQNTSIYLFIL